ncbi:hypothetical protein CHLRE_05g234700v5 [Chlamydomonas reinhardtii]|uniref:Pyruvate kinase n=1 Tax=Chlamydomonas reinhardtii TaxID=3055 RepID=A0A2K3DST4_CHLRE|nr:uncharacterized protein CHLRE_05g234700v5 [Chlamydomonas reinhardtii]PNW83558.1 hypothetical protein CHLRE_05g234700v5 [Chlamydomonas reinhardtii]
MGCGSSMHANPGSAPIAQGAPGAITKSGSGKSGNATPENGHTPRDKEAPEKPAATKQEAVQPTSPSKSQSQSLAFDDRSVRKPKTQASLAKTSSMHPAAMSVEEQTITAVKAKLQREWAPEYEPEEIRPPQDTPDVHSERATNVTLSMILKDQEELARKTKIICTAGPACWSEEGLGKLLDAGCNVLRFNFSHGDHDGHYSVLERFRKVCTAKGSYAACLLDTKGPEIRTAMLKDGKDIELEAGQSIVVEAVGAEYTKWEGYKDAANGETHIGLSYDKLCSSVKPGSKILLADGSISIRVDEITSARTLRGTVMNSKKLGQRKNCNLPGVKVDIPVLTEKDIDDLQQFAAKHKMDFVAASFVQSAADVQFIRRTLDAAPGGEHVKIISKIENLEGLKNYDEILRESDGIMVARGDLGMEIPSEKVPVAQKMMITKANIAGKFVICATQMLESMISNPRPTRAEMTDVANAVYDGVDCVMLSGESANGDFPDIAVSTMAAIVANAEVGVDYYSQYSFIRYWATKGNEIAMTPDECMMSSVASMAVGFTEDTTPEAFRRVARNNTLTIIVVLTADGRAANLVSKYRPPCLVVVASTNEQVLRQAAVSFGQVPLALASLELDSQDLAEKAVEKVRSLGLVAQHTPDCRLIVARGRNSGSADVEPVVTVVKTGGSGLKRRGWSTGNTLYTPSGVPIQRPGVRSLRTTLTNLPLITAPIKNGRCTKVICTMGPSCWSEETMGKLLDAGMDIIRLNFSHGDHKGHFEVLERFRKVCKTKQEEFSAKGAPSAPHWGCLLDTKGPEIRTAMLKDGKDIELVAGQTIFIEAVGADYVKWEGYKDEATGETRIGLSYGKLCSSVQQGNKILLADGSISIVVEEVCSANLLRGTVLNSKKLGQRKNCNLPGVKVDIPVLTEKDIDDLQNFCAKHEMDYVAASFVQSAADVQFIRRVLDEAGGHRVKIISKIENAEGLVNYDEILRESDGIMVARGDLGMEIPAEKVPLAQKMMITKANIAGKFIITATQMLESMISNPRPTRAEMTDVANAVLDGTDCVMLSGETANGSFPEAAVSTMAAICLNAEQMVEVNKRFRFLRNHTPKPMRGAEAVASGAVMTAIDTDAKLMVCITTSGRGVALVSKYRPPMPVVVVTPDAQLVRHCRSVFGQVGVLVPDIESVELNKLVELAAAAARSFGLADVTDGDQIVVLQRRKASPETMIYDDQRLVARAMVYGKAPINEVAHTRYPGDKVVFHRSTKVGLDTILDEEKWKFIVRKTKIICTAGPACWSEEGLGKLLDAGCNIVRLNFSHGDHEGHFSVLQRWRKVCAEKDSHAACLLDTKGPEIRTAMLKDGKDIELVANQKVTIHAVGDEYVKWEGYKDAATGETHIGLSYGKLCSSVKAGNRILLADGSISIVVDEIVDGTTLIGTVLNTKKLGQRKNCNLPGVKVDIPVLTKKDIDDLQNFCVKHKMDFVAASFVQSQQDVLYIRSILDDAGGKDVKIISKIENAEGLKNFDEILEVTDGVMVARGDLGMEIPVEKVPLAQKMLITKANIAGKFVICATQMMESMITNPVPTRAEMTDVANAVWDGVDAVMLSGESANGAYFGQAVETMARIARSAEIGVNFYQSFDYTHKFTPKPVSAVEAMCSSLAKNAVDIRPGMIVVFSEGGKVARLVAKYRPCAPVLVVTSNAGLARYCSSLFGCYPRLLPEPIKDVAAMPKAVSEAMAYGVERGLCVAGKEVIVLVSNMVAKGVGADASEALPERQIFVTIAPGALNIDALGSLAFSTSALDPKFVAKTISLRSTTIDLPMLVSSSSPVRKTKLGFTMGPSCNSEDVLRQLVRGGANIARFNFAHGEMAAHQAMLNKLRTVCAAEGRTVAVMLDLDGNVLRTSDLIDYDTKQPIKKIELQAGDKVELYGTDDTSPNHFVGYKVADKVRIGVSLADLAECVKPGGLIRVHDGLITFEVVSVRPGGPVQAVVLNHAFLYARKPVHLVGVTIHSSFPAPADLEALMAFALPNAIEFVAVGVNSRNDVNAIRSFLDDNGGESIKLIAKIESEGGLRNLDEIIDAADGVILARGKLGMVVTPEKVALAQSVVVTKANVAGKPVIISRQMLESMVSNPRPTRAEMTDVANAVLDGASCLMLCSETSSGAFPADSFTTAVNIVRNAEHATSYASMHSFIRDFSAKPFNTIEAAAVALAQACMDSKLALCLVVSDTGEAANIVTKYRPPVPVMVVSSQPPVVAQRELCFGQFGYLASDGIVSAPAGDVRDLAADVVADARARGLCGPEPQRVAVMTGSSAMDVVHNAIVQIVEV